MPLPLRRLAFVLTAIATVLALTATSAAAGGASGLLALVEVGSAQDGMNSTGVEFSGATYNADRHVLLTVDDEHNAYEFPLGLDGAIDASQSPRIIELNLGTNDFEGVAWIAGEKYGFLSEASGEVIVATVPAPQPNGTTTIGVGDIERSFGVISGSWGNLGPEGLATDGSAFYVTRELPATISKFTFAGQFVGSVDLFELADASGVAVLADGSYLVVSHESRMVVHYEINWDTEVATELARRDADLFTQLEGIALVGSSEVHLFGEDNSRKGQTGKTYSHLQGPVVTPIYAVGDVNCSGTLTLADALIVARIGAGSMNPRPGCGSGDHNGDGVVDLTDALQMAQCQVRVHNIGCPPTID